MKKSYIKSKKLLDKLYKILLELELEDLVEIQNDDWIDPLMDDLILRVL